MRRSQRHAPPRPQQAATWQEPGAEEQRAAHHQQITCGTGLARCSTPRPYMRNASAEHAERAIAWRGGERSDDSCTANRCVLRDGSAYGATMRLRRLEGSAVRGSVAGSRRTAVSHNTNAISCHAVCVPHHAPQARLHRRPPPRCLAPRASSPACQQVAAATHGQPCQARIACRTVGAFSGQRSAAAARRAAPLPDLKERRRVPPR